MTTTGRRPHELDERGIAALATFHYSKQALDMMTTIRASHTLYGWRNF